ncbi:MAG: hypothetical protein JWQ76_3802, partial [Ramlibacter sp.]|nr:hypothetical protein [Ramlibacter sp.]
PAPNGGDRAGAPARAAEPPADDMAGAQA